MSVDAPSIDPGDPQFEARGLRWRVIGEHVIASVSNAATTLRTSIYFSVAQLMGWIDALCCVQRGVTSLCEGARENL